MNSLRNAVAYSGYFLRALYNVPGDIVFYIKAAYKEYMNMAETIIECTNMSNIFDSIFLLCGTAIYVALTKAYETLGSHLRARAIARAGVAFMPAAGSFIDRQIIGEWNEQI